VQTEGPFLLAGIIPVHSTFSGMPGLRSNTSEIFPACPMRARRGKWRKNKSFVNELTGYLSGLHADRIERNAKGADCEIIILFRL
jgi:hypothetical protein